MAITAADVKKLRDATGAGMMDAKKALTEAGGDYDKAVEILKSDEYGLNPIVQEDPSCPATDPRMVKVQSAIGEVPVGSDITLTTCSG